MNNYGTLYICATPIGNLEDVTLRVLRVLREADFIAAEDTRVTLKLLNRFGIKTPLTSYHEHNRVSAGARIIERLKGGESCALVTDAGMPCVSDPGADIVDLCRDEGLNVVVCPGASAVVSAVALAGFCKEGRFSFEGFLPERAKLRRERIAELRDERRNAVIYESPKRIGATLAELAAALGETRRAAVVKEMTKAHEGVRRGCLGELAETFKGEQRGEFAVVIEGVPAKEAEAAKSAEWLKISAAEHVKMYVERGLDEMAAIKAAAKDRGVAKSAVYSEVKGG